jgi:DNA-binding CsgD family transcriptional regulator
MKKVEFFSSGENVFALLDDQVISFDQFPIDLMEMIRTDLEKNPVAQKALCEMGLTGIDELKQYIFCRYSVFNSIPDFTENVSAAEFVQCEKRGRCKWEGILCLKSITRRETEVARLIALDLADKQIADKLNISVNTVTTHRQNILQKIQAHSKAGIAAFAVFNNII